MGAHRHIPPEQQTKCSSHKGEHISKDKLQHVIIPLYMQEGGRKKISVIITGFFFLFAQCKENLWGCSWFFFLFIYLFLSLLVLLLLLIFLQFNTGPEGTRELRLYSFFVAVVVPLKIKIQLLIHREL